MDFPVGTTIRGTSTPLELKVQENHLERDIPEWDTLSSSRFSSPLSNLTIDFFHPSTVDTALINTNYNSYESGRRRGTSSDSSFEGTGPQRNSRRLRRMRMSTRSSANFSRNPRSCPSCGLPFAAHSAIKCATERRQRRYLTFGSDPAPRTELVDTSDDT
jgi:hypothetical protein